MTARQIKRAGQNRADRILRIARVVKRVRKDLGLTQWQLDAECGFSNRMVEKIERQHVDRRSIDPDHDAVLLVMAKLEEILLRPSGSDQVEERERPARSRSNRAPLEVEVSSVEVLYLCPEMRSESNDGAWMNQSACESLLDGHHATCISRNGRRCNGVESRRSRLASKRVEVVVAPTTSAATHVRRILIS